MPSRSGRTREPPAAAKPDSPAQLTLEEVERLAAAEGLTLERTESTSGFKGVSYDAGKKSKPYQAKPKIGGRSNHLGMFVTAEEAALAIARFLGPEGGAGAAEPMPAEDEYEVDAEDVVVDGEEGAAAPTDASAPADLVAVLAQAGLAEHTDAFVDIGYDDVNYLTEVAEEGGLGEALSDLGLGAAQLRWRDGGGRRGAVSQAPRRERRRGHARGEAAGGAAPLLLRPPRGAPRRSLRLPAARHAELLHLRPRR